MLVSVTEAKTHLLDLVRRAEAGEEILLTRHGEPVVQLVAVPLNTTAEERRAALMEALGAATVKEGPSAAHSADFLYDENGLPG